MWLDRVGGEDLADRAVRDAAQSRMPGGSGMVADVAGKKAHGPNFVRIAQVLGFSAGQRDQPHLGVYGALRRLARPGAVIERRNHTRRITESRHCSTVW